ncbi:MAG: rhodanese-like domain-containing protein [Candidatus Bipolaricaulota bacterium]
MFNKKGLVALTLALAVLATGSLAAIATEEAVVDATNDFLKDIHKNGFYIASQEEVNKQRKVRPNLFILDVRTPGEVEKGKIPGATPIRLSELAMNLDKLPDDKDTTIYAYCKGGTRSAYAVAVLHTLGYTEAYNMGGFVAWKDAGYPVE